MAQGSYYVRREQYSKNGFFQIRDAGTQDWHVPPHYGMFWVTKTNVAKPTFNPGTISITQLAVEPSYDTKAVLQSDLYKCKATFSVTDLYDIRVRERHFGTQDHPQSHVELQAVCKSPPISQLLVNKAGTRIHAIVKDAVDTSDPSASSIAIANLSDRWVSGDQEIFLSFTRSTAIKRKPGPKKAQIKKEPVTGPKVWVWNAFLAFLCGLEWEAPRLEIFENAAKKSLTQIVDSKLPNPYADFEKKDDDWVLIKISNVHARNPNPNARFSVVPGQSGPSAAVAGPSAPRMTFSARPLPMAASSAPGAGPPAPRKSFAARPPPTAVSSAVLAGRWASSAWVAGADLSESVKDGKRKAKEEVEEEGNGTRVELGNRLQLERELVEVQCEARLAREEERRFGEKARLWQEEERRFGEKAETVEAREKSLQQQLESLNIE